MKFFLLQLIILTAFCQCGRKNDRIQENANKFNQEKKVSIICLKENDTLHVKMINYSPDTIFIPKQYDGDFTNNDDTLYLETQHKPQHNTTYYYLYKSIFPFDFFTTRKIDGYEPDSVEVFTKQSYFYNQFRVQDIISVAPDSSYMVRLQFDAPKYATIVKAVYYDRKFLNSSNYEYTIEDYLKFDSLHAKYTSGQILIRYR